MQDCSSVHHSHSTTSISAAICILSLLRFQALFVTLFFFFFKQKTAYEMPLLVVQRLDEADELVLGGFELLRVLVRADMVGGCHRHIDSVLGMTGPVLSV